MFGWVMDILDCKGDPMVEKKKKKGSLGWCISNIFISLIFSEGQK